MILLQIEVVKKGDVFEKIQFNLHIQTVNRKVHGSLSDLLTLPVFHENLMRSNTVIVIASYEGAESWYGRCLKYMTLGIQGGMVCSRNANYSESGP